MAATIPFAYLFLLPSDLFQFALSAVAALLFGANFFFATSAEYGATSSLLLPFLHTWSLSVEEQFYILFPALLWTLRKASLDHILIIVVIALLSSLAFSEFMTTRDQNLNFYLLPSRAWELLAGSVIAIKSLRPQEPSAVWLRQTATTVGILMIVGSIFWFDHQTRHPGIITTLPIVGVAMIIHFSRGDDFFGALLKSKPLVGIGLISYSLYLWHFPIFAFGRILNSAPSDLDKLAWIGLTIALSIASYYFVERPFRNPTHSPNKRLAVVAAGFIALFSINSLIVKQDGLPHRLSPILEEHLQYRTLRDVDGTSCLGRVCRHRSTDTEQRLVLMGDSHAGPLAVDLFARTQGQYDHTMIASGGCLPIITPSSVCLSNEQTEALKNAVIEGGNIFVFAARLPLWISGMTFNNGEGGIERDANGSFEELVDSIRARPNTLHPAFNMDQLGQTFRYILDHGNALVLVYPVPEVGWHVPRRLVELGGHVGNISQDQLTSNPVTTSYGRYADRTRLSFEFLDTIIGDNVYRVYPDRIFCNTEIAERCLTHNQTHLFYSDDDHHVGKGSEMINDLILDQLRQIEGAK